MIKFTDTTEYREDVISLWNECFGDSREYIEFFLENCSHECIGFFENGSLLSMLFLLDGAIDKYILKYIYAACTARKFRGRGYMSEIMEYAKTYCGEIGCDGIFLVPAEESLYSFYSRFGFESVFNRYDLSFKGGIQIENFKETNSIELILDLREQLLYKENTFVFDRKTAEYSIIEHLNSGGKIFFENSEMFKFLFFFSKANNNIEIKEMLCTDTVKMLKILEHFTNIDTDNIYIRSPIVYNSRDIMVKSTKCGMCCFLTDEFKTSSVGKSFYAGIYLD